MKFQKLEILEYKDDFNIYYGVINNKFAILKENKNISDEIIIPDEKLIRLGNVYQMKKNDLFLLNYPVDESLVDSYREKSKIVKETYEDYKTKIEPYINSILDNNTKWINNILNNKSETDRILIKNEKFLIIKNLSWEQDNDFYVLVIPYEKIKNIRHLNKSHEQLLTDMKLETLKLAKKYNIDEDELYFFFHYHPSCYHLHLHCCMINHKALKLKFHRHVMLDDIKENINDLEKKTIKYEINISNPIYKLLKN
jgi:m7GpppX diphosphatase